MPDSGDEAAADDAAGVSEGVAEPDELDPVLAPWFHPVDAAALLFSPAGVAAALFEPADAALDSPVPVAAPYEDAAFSEDKLF